MISIDKQLINTMPIATFPGRSIVVDNVDEADKAVDYLSTHGMLGFDTETRPTFKKGEVHNVALVQLATDDECYLFRTNVIGFTTSLMRLMENPDVLKIGLSTKDDIHGLAHYTTFVPGGIVELQRTVKQYQIEDMSLQKIYAILFGEHITKGQRLTNWEAKELTPHQMAYASLDAWACLRIYRHLQGGNFDPRYYQLPTR